MPDFGRIDSLMLARTINKHPVRVATLGNVTLNAAPNTIDDISLSVGDRILVCNQTTSSQNGIYDIISLGTGSDGVWERSFDLQLSIDLFSGLSVYVSSGTANAKKTFHLTTIGQLTLGTSSLTFEELSAYTDANARAAIDLNNGLIWDSNTGVGKLGGSLLTNTTITTGIYGFTFQNDVNNYVSFQNGWYDLYYEVGSEYLNLYYDKTEYYIGIENATHTSGIVQHADEYHVNAGTSDNSSYARNSVDAISGVLLGYGANTGSGVLDINNTQISLIALSTKNTTIHGGTVGAKGIRVAFTGDIKFDAYPNTRNDGTTASALYVTADGSLRYGAISLGTTISEPANQIVYGTGTGVTSSSRLTYGSGTLGIGGDTNNHAIYMSNLAVGVMGVLQWTSADIYLRNNTATGAIRFGTNSINDRMVFDSAGKLNINKTAPTHYEYLSVNGMVYSVNNTLYAAGGSNFLGQSTYLMNTTTHGSISNGAFTGSAMFSTTYNIDGTFTMLAGKVFTSHYTHLTLSATSNAASAIVTIGQANGIRAASAHLVQIVLPTIGAGYTTRISHIAGMQLLAPFAQGNGPYVSIDNYYALVLNPTDEYNGTTITNRWGLYQQGANDKNYFGGEVQLNTAPTYSSGGYDVLVRNQTSKRIEKTTISAGSTPTLQAVTTAGGTTDQNVTFNASLNMVANNNTTADYKLVARENTTGRLELLTNGIQLPSNSTNPSLGNGSLYFNDISQTVKILQGSSWRDIINSVGATFTPTISSTSNISSYTFRLARYSKVDNIVTVTISLNITPTATGTISFSHTLPVAISGTFADGQEVAGVAIGSGTTGDSGSIYAQDLANYGRFSGKVTTTSAQTWTLMYQYTTQ